MLAHRYHLADRRDEEAAEVIASNEKLELPSMAFKEVREVASQTSQKPSQGSLPVL